jgi:hypothetical protein
VPKDRELARREGREGGERDDEQQRDPDRAHAVIPCRAPSAATA